MNKYYTRACNFYFGSTSKKNIAFDNIEIFSREKSRVKVNQIHINKINKLNKDIKKIVNYDLKNITSKRKNFLKNIKKKKRFKKLNLSNIPILMGIINLTPDSFSDGGE